MREYEQFKRQLQEPREVIFDPTAPLGWPEDDPDWPAPGGARGGYSFGRLSPYSNAVCMITAWEMALPEWKRLAAQLPHGALEEMWANALPLTIAYAWAFIHDELDQEFLRQWAAHLHTGFEFFRGAASRARGITMNAPGLTDRIVASLRESFDNSASVNRFGYLLGSARWGIQAISGLSRVPYGDFRLAHDIALSPSHPETDERWWALCRRRLAIRDV